MYDNITSREPAFRKNFVGPRVAKERNIQEATFSDNQIGIKDEERPTVQFYLQNRLVSSRSLSHSLVYERSKCHVSQHS